MRAAYTLAFLYCDHGRWDDAADCLAYGRDVPAGVPGRRSRLPARRQARLAAHRGRVAEALTLARARGRMCAGSATT